MPPNSGHSHVLTADSIASLISPARRKQGALVQSKLNFGPQRNYHIAYSRKVQSIGSNFSANSIGRDHYADEGEINSQR